MVILASTQGGDLHWHMYVYKSGFLLETVKCLQGFCLFMDCISAIMFACSHHITLIQMHLRLSQDIDPHVQISESNWMRRWISFYYKTSPQQDTSDVSTPLSNAHWLHDVSVSFMSSCFLSACIWRPGQGMFAS